MNDSRRYAPSVTRAGFFAALSLLLGLLFSYGFSDLQIGYPTVNSVIGAVSLLVSCCFTLWILYRNYLGLAMTYWGTGLAMLLSVLPLYVALKSAAFICHVRAAKWVTLLIGFAGVSMLFYGFVRSLETRKTVLVEGSPDPSLSEAWSQSEIKNLSLLVMLLLALFVLWQRFLVKCWC